MPINDDYKVFLTKRSDQENIYRLLDRKYGISVVKNITINMDIDTPVISGKIELLRLEDFSILELGDMIDIHGPVVHYSGEITNEHLFRLFLFKQIINDRGSLIFSIRNVAHWTTSSEVYFKVEDNETLTSVMRRSAEKYQIPIDHLEETTFRLPAKLYERVNLYKLWLNCLSLSYSKQGILYYINFSPNGLRLDVITANQIRGVNRDSILDVFWYNVRDNNIIGPKRTIDLNHKNMINDVRGVVRPNQSGGVFGKLKSNLTEVRRLNIESIRQYGVFPKYIDITDYATNVEAEEYLDSIIKKGQPIDQITFKSFATNNIKPSDRIFVTAPQLYTSGEYYIQNLELSIKENNFLEMITASKLRNIPVNLPEKVSEGGTGVFGELGRT